jgi:hypothetical protein
MESPTYDSQWFYLFMTRWETIQEDSARVTQGQSWQLQFKMAVIMSNWIHITCFELQSCQEQAPDTLSLPPYADTSLGVLLHMEKAILQQLVWPCAHHPQAGPRWIIIQALVYRIWLAQLRSPNSVQFWYCITSNGQWNHSWHGGTSRIRVISQADNPKAIV